MFRRAGLLSGLGCIVVLALAGLGYTVSAAPALAAASAYRTTAGCNALSDTGRGVSLKRLVGGPVCGGLDRMSQTLASRVAAHATLSQDSSATGSPAYPLRVSADGRYLVDQHDVPFLLIGDSPQAMVGQLSEADARLFFENRQRYGFNTVWINLLCTDYTGCNADGSTFDGIAPFTTAGDLSTPNELYFARVERLVQLAGDYGIQVILDPIETGGWLTTLKANGVDRAHAYGRYVGQRFAAEPNIIWMNGNDFQTWRDPDDDALVQAVARGLQETDRTHLQTVELDYFASTSRDDSGWAPLIDTEAAYSYYPTYAEVLEAYNRPDPLPVLMVEANYEFENFYSGPQTLRRQEYWTLLSGATGQLYGNKYTWPFVDGWKEHLDTVGSLDMAFVRRLFASRPWFNLVPDQQHTLVTDGYGTFGDSGDPNANDFVAAARASDGRLAIVYIPSGDAITVDLQQMTGSVDASWYDPSSGSYSPIDSAPLLNTGSRVFQAPGRNADGDSDWVLVLEAHD